MEAGYIGCAHVGTARYGADVAAQAWRGRQGCDAAVLPCLKKARLTRRDPPHLLLVAEAGLAIKGAGGAGAAACAVRRHMLRRPAVPLFVG